MLIAWAPLILESSSGMVTNVLHCNIEVSEFEVTYLNLHCYVQFWTNLNSTTTVFLHED